MNESKYIHQFLTSVSAELSFHIGMSKFAHIFNHLHNLKEISLEKMHCRRVRNGKKITQLHIFSSILSLMIYIPSLKEIHLPRATTLNNVWAPFITTEEGEQVSH